MLGSRKNTPIIFFFLALTLLFLPTHWLSQPELLLLTCLKPVNYLFAESVEEPVLPDQDISSLSPVEQVKVMRKQVADLKAELQQVYNENRRLSQQLQAIADFTGTQPQNFTWSKNYQLITANVLINHDVSGWRKSLVINRGSHNGIASGLPVISGRYLVGKVSKVSPFTSRIQLITDPGFRIRAHVVSTPKTVKEKSKLIQGEGVLEGYSTHRTALKWVSRDVPVQPGWLVFTSADFYQIWPRGLIIGTVESLVEEGYFYRLKIEPVIDFNNLSQVIILKKKGNN